MIVFKVQVFVEAFKAWTMNMSTHSARHIHTYAKGVCKCLGYAV